MTAKRALATGWTVFAAVLMIFGGVMTILAGISAIANDDIFLATRNYVFSFSLLGWGWVHLFIGAIIFVAGCALLRGAVWARVVGVILAGLGAISNFLWIPRYPLWALVLLAVDLFIIWALCAGDRRRSER
ncbi:hypothetical protein ABTZ59_07635 [Streptomyces sp. NPDC094034]|uniref:DUF7144 family membrane protein n=1 Tax=Streptomyces sp. NPDC094034 TaxID=3155309 RepID=UPI003327FE2C